MDRCPEAFQHVLELMRDPQYPYPKKYLYELDFYGLSEPVDLRSGDSEVAVSFLDRIARSIEGIAEGIQKIHEDLDNIDDTLDEIRKEKMAESIGEQRW